MVLGEFVLPMHQETVNLSLIEKKVIVDLEM